MPSKQPSQKDQGCGREGISGRQNDLRKSGSGRACSSSFIIKVCIV